MWSFKSILVEGAKRLVSNVVEVVTTKTSLMTIAGIAADVVTSGGTLTVKSLGFLALRIVQQSFADHGKNKPVAVEAGGKVEPKPVK